jgi:hypothetical protein
MTKSWLLSAVASFGILSVTGSPHAELINGSFTGIVTSDQNGAAAVFGVLPGDLVGMTIAGTFSYDTANLPAPYAPLTSSVESEWLSNNSDLMVAETINGVTESYGGSCYDSLNIQNGGPGALGHPAAQVFGLNSYDCPNGHQYSVAVIAVISPTENPNFIGDPGNPLVSFSLTNLPDDYVGLTGAGQGGLTDGGPYWDFNITNISASLPEPASCLVLSAGALGVASIRRRGRGARDARAV